MAIRDYGSDNGSGVSGGSQVGGYGATGSGNPGDTGTGIDPGTQSNGGQGNGGGGAPLPSTPIGNGYLDPITGGTSMADPSAWDAAGNFIGASTVNNATGGGLLANILRSLFGGSDNQGLNTLLKALAGAGGVIGGHALANNAAQQAIPPQLTQMLNTSASRQQYQNPLFQAVNQGTYAMLPSYAKTGNPGLDPSVLK